MTIYEVLFIILIVAFVVFIFGREVYLKIKHKSSGECRYCHSNSKKLLKQYRKKYKKNNC